MLVFVVLKPFQKEHTFWVRHSLELLWLMHATEKKQTNMKNDSNVNRWQCKFKYKQMHAYKTHWKLIAPASGKPKQWHWLVFRPPKNRCFIARCDSFFVERFNQSARTYWIHRTMHARTLLSYYIVVSFEVTLFKSNNRMFIGVTVNRSPVPLLLPPLQSTKGMRIN